MPARRNRGDRGRTARVRARRGERGSVVVEAAVVAPLLFFLIFGIIEAGNLFYANLAVDEMAGHAARTASIYGLATDADYKVLQRVKNEQGANKVSRIRYVVVYKAANRGDGPSSSCKAGTSSASCSVYVAADFAKTSGALVCGWCAAARNSGDLIGVWVSYSQPSVTGILGAKTLSSQSVGKIEAAS